MRNLESSNYGSHLATSDTCIGAALAIENSENLSTVSVEEKSPMLVTYNSRSCCFLWE